MLSRLLPRLIAPAVAIALLAICPSASAIGIFVPIRPESPVPTLLGEKISVVIKDAVAHTSIKQTYHNSGSRPAEADFYLPIPEGASLADFSIMLDGKELKGEVLDKEQAQNTYRDIVRKLKDPGLVEWSEKNLFHVRAFPVPPGGTQSMTFELLQNLTKDQEFYRYSLPQQSQKGEGNSASKTRYTVTIEDGSAARNIYSPTHTIDTATSTGKTALVTAEGNDASSFQLFWQVSSAPVALGVTTYKPNADNGYFALRISPPWQTETTASTPGDFLFILDTSGSMADQDKLAQARNALQYCVRLLGPGDRFGLVQFSTGVSRFSDALSSATADQKEQANKWLDALQARGGTNISEALATALEMKPKDATGRIYTVIFLTDGLPTIGETSADAIVKAAETTSNGSTRIFTFGVGNDVNTRLLDAIAQNTRAVSDYISPNQDMEVPVGRFFDKINRPALANLDLRIPGADISDVLPHQLPDLYYGTEITVLGRYAKASSATVTLTGQINGEKKSYESAASFSADAPASHAYIEKLWATRKVGWLLDEIRKNGESAELKTEVETLAKKYAIVTPYTSYLAVEDKDLQQPVPAGAPASSAASGTSLRFHADKASAQDMAAESGAGAVRASREVAQMKSAASPVPASSQTKTAGGKTFVLSDGTWKDQELSGNEQTIIKIKTWSDQWFQLADGNARLKEIFAVGDHLEIKVSAEIKIIVSPDTTDNTKLTADQLTLLKKF